jgi:HEAT repeat protein
MRCLRALTLAAGVGLCTQAGAAAQAADAQAGAPGLSAVATQATPVPPPAENLPEPPITIPGVEGDYLRAVHFRIHWRWTHYFIEGVAMQRPPGDPLNDPTLAAEILFTIRWDGSPAEVTLSKTSGIKEFDQAAVAAVRGDIKYPVPPLAVFGDDGVAHLRWSFARDHRLCSDAELRRREDPLEEALPRLFIQGRYKEALLRVTRAMDAGDTRAMSTFARAWLARPFTNKVADASAAEALALVGDTRQLARLRPALSNPETALIAARGLAALKVDLCAELDPVLRAREPAAVDQAMTVLREIGQAAPGAPCLATLAAMVDDETAPRSLRAIALKTFAGLDPAAARKRTILLLADPSPELRAAAALAFGRPGGGRPALYRLEPMLKDAKPEVRAAAAAALVRAAGELSFDYLNPLFKNNDVRALVAIAPPLGELSSEASADMLARLLKRGEPDLKLAVTRALATRKDEKARALYKPLGDAAKRSAYTPHELKLFLYSVAPVEELLPLAKDPHLGILAYKAMLRSKRHKEAAEWLVSRFDHSTPEVIGQALGAWLARPPAG